MIKVLIIDDHDLIRQGISRLLELESDIDVIGTANDGMQGIRLLEELKPDVILMDINMPGMNGIETLKKIRETNQSVKIIMLTIHEDEEYLLETMNFGADGYILKDADVTRILEAIRKVNEGGTYIHPTLSGAIVKEYRRQNDYVNQLINSDMTKRELEVIDLIARGKTNKEISDELFISEKTVKNHVSNIFKKIGVKDRTQAAVYAIRNNITKI